MTKYTVLYNPIAGGGKCSETVDRLCSLMKDDELTPVDMTSLEDYGKFFSENEGPVIVCGGDGTLNRFINDTSDLSIKNDTYFYPSGTGNDFLRDVCPDTTKPLLINKYIKDLPEVTVKGKTYKFLNGVGYGIDGYCCEVGDELRLKSDKPVNYAGIAIKGLLFHFKPVNAVVTVDGVRHEYKKVWLAPTMNGRFYGGGMMPTPDQDRLSDKKTVSVMIFHGSGKLKTLMIFPSIFKGEHVKKKKYVEVLTGHRIKVEFDRPCALQIDGETVLGVNECSVATCVTKEISTPETV